MAKKRKASTKRRYDGKGAFPTPAAYMQPRRGPGRPPGSKNEERRLDPLSRELLDVAARLFALALRDW